MMAVGIRQDLGEVEWPKRSPQGWTLWSNSSSHTFYSHARIQLFLSLMHALQIQQMESPPHLNLKGVVYKMDNN